MLYVTSDLQLGRKSISDQRGFSSPRVMANQIIQNWNSVVNDDDIVYCLGNFAIDPLAAESALESLNGSIYFMIGEWDKAIQEIIHEFPTHTVIPEQIVSIQSYDLVLSYWALERWVGMDDGSIHIHGGPFSKTDLTKGFKFNSSIEAWNYKPLSLDIIDDLVKISSTNF